MADTGNRGRMTPEIRVKVGGAELPVEAHQDVLAVTVHDDIDYPATFVLQLDNWDDAKVDMKWSDRDLFQAGKPVEIEMGYRDDLTPMISGEVTGLELSGAIQESPVFTVRGYDQWHRLMRGKKTMTYTKMKESDIAGQIASNAGLTPDSEDSSQVLDYVLQHNQSDAEFLRTRARRIGYEVFVRDTKLVYRPRKHQEEKMAVVSREDDGLEFQLSLSTLRQVSDVEVRGWDAVDKKIWIGKASTSDETAKMGGKQGGLEVTAGAFGKSTVAGVHEPPASQAEADQAAKAALQERALAYVTAEGSCIGRTDLRAGVVAEIDGLGKRFSGLYYLSSTRHVFRRNAGYRTEFVARRSAT